MRNVGQLLSKIRMHFICSFFLPVSGYITVYLDDKEFSQCLYPHYNMSTGFDGGVPVEADKKYFLFSDKSEYSYFPDMNINQLHMSCILLVFRDE